MVRLPPATAAGSRRQEQQQQQQQLPARPLEQHCCCPWGTSLSLRSTVVATAMGPRGESLHSVVKAVMTPEPPPPARRNESWCG